MSEYPGFFEQNAPAISCRKASLEMVQKYEKKLPSTLLEFWKEAGWCGYAAGLIWFDNPEDFVDVLKDWSVPKESVAIGHTAFGDLFLWSEDQVQFLFVNYGRLAPLTRRFDVFMNGSLSDPRYIREGLWGKEYKKLVKRLGPPAADECYAFVPALALGGTEDFDSMQKVKIREHLSILGQLNG